MATPRAQRNRYVRLRAEARAVRAGRVLDALLLDQPR
jgi:hypothetical protein